MNERACLILLTLALLALSTASPAQHRGGAAAIDGPWSGELSVQGAGFPFAVTFEGSGPAFSAEMDIIASLSPDVELTRVAVKGDSVGFSLPLSGGESVRFDGVLVSDRLVGTAVYSEDANVSGEFILEPLPLELLPAWARGEETWNWPDVDRDYWPTDEWRTARAEEVGLDAALLAAADEAIETGFASVRALLVVRGGRLAHERYYHGGHADEAINIKSVSKGIVTGLVGLAIREGHLGGPGDAISSLLPEYFEGGDARKELITVRNLLEMTSGLPWVENGDLTREWASRGHSSAYYFSLPLECDPGECFNYSTASTHALSEILSRETGMTTREFAEHHVFGPIGLELRDWWQAQNGVHIGGADVLMTARDMARLGFLFLNRGNWGGREIIPSEWVSTCADYHGEGEPFIGSYGYGWWRRSVGGHPTLIGKGYGGQFILIVPDLDLVVIVGSDISSPETSPVLEYWVCQSVIPAAFTSE